MGVNYSSCVVVGIKVTRNDFYEKREVPGCEHREIPKGAKFCPTCGKPAAKIKKIPIDGYDECDHYRELELVHPGFETDEIVLGRVMVEIDDYDCRKEPSVALDQGMIEEARQEVMDVLEGSPFKGDIKIWLCWCVS